MNTTLKSGLLVASLGFAFAALQADAALAEHSFASNAVNYCKSTFVAQDSRIRNRVIGAENVSSAHEAVSCSFHTMDNGGAGNTAPIELTLYFSNFGNSEITVTCTLRAGVYGDTSSYSVNKTTGPIPPGGASRQALTWLPSDNPITGATDLGHRFIGLSCLLPPAAIMNDVYVYWLQDNGI